MAITVAEIQTELNTIIGDATTDRISAAERLQFISQATIWAQQESANDHQISTLTVPYFDSVYYYKLSDSLTDFFEANDVRQKVGEGFNPFTKKDAREIAEDIASKSSENAYAIERRDGNVYLVINHDSKYSALVAASMDSLTENGTWDVDAVNSDATNLDVNHIDYTEGNYSFSFDIDVSQSSNNRATIENSTISSEDLSEDKDVSSWLLDVKFPDVTYITSVTFYWGSDSSNYYYVTQTTDQLGNSFVANDWITCKFNWSSATQVGTPDDTAIAYLRIDVNYSASQGDDTGFKLDNLRLVQPELLTLHYTSWNIGTNSSGTPIKKFTATTDIPYFSGQYDNYLYPVAHKAASLAYRSLRLRTLATDEEVEAQRQLNKINDIIPKSLPRETKNFKVKGVNFSRRSFRR